MNRKLLLLGCGLLFSGLTQAAPVQYTFSGIVTQVADVEGVIADLAPGVDFLGMNAEYVVLIDTERQGQATTYEGFVEVYNDFDIPGVQSFDSIYAELISGSLVDQNDGYFSNTDPEAYESINWASSSRIENPLEIGSGIDVGTDDDLFSARPTVPMFLFDWALGTEFRGTERVFASDRYAWGEIVSRLEITDISAVSAIPIPAGFVLFGTALLGLLGIRRQLGTGSRLANISQAD